MSRGREVLARRARCGQAVVVSDRRSVVVVLVGLALVAGIGATPFRSLPLAATARVKRPVSSSVADVKEVFALAVDVYQSLTSLPPTVAEGSSMRGLSVRSAKSVKLGLPVLQDDERAAPIVHLDSSGRLTPVSATELDAWNAITTDVLTKLFAGDLLANYTAAVRNAALVQSHGVTATGAPGQPVPSHPVLAGGGGVDVTKFRSVKVSGSTAVVSARVRSWLRLGYVDPDSGVVTWQLAEGDEQMDTTLKRDPTGHWKVTGQHLQGGG
jgi:hypothetical protein